MSASDIPAPPRRTRLLIVDDLEPVRAALAQVLEKAGYEIVTAGTAGEALGLAQGSRWDGVVLDVDLGGSSGVELYARMLRLRGDRRLPVVFFSGRSHHALRLSLKGTAWAQVLEKPCRSKNFLAVLEECLQAAANDAAAPGG